MKTIYAVAPGKIDSDFKLDDDCRRQIESDGLAGIGQVDKIHLFLERPAISVAGLAYSQWQSEQYQNDRGIDTITTFAGLYRPFQALLPYEKIKCQIERGYDLFTALKMHCPITFYQKWAIIARNNQISLLQNLPGGCTCLQIIPRPFMEMIIDACQEFRYYNLCVDYPEAYKFTLAVNGKISLNFEPVV